MAKDVDKESDLSKRLWAVTITSPEAQQAVTGVLDAGGQTSTEPSEILVKDGKGGEHKIQAYTINNQTRQRLLQRQTDTPFAAEFYWKTPGADDTWHLWKKGVTVGKEAIAKLLRSRKPGVRIDFADRLPRRDGTQINFADPKIKKPK